MKLIKGVHTDTTFEDQPAQSMAWAHNILMSEKYGAITNDLGFEQLANIPTGANIIGGIALWDERIVVFLDTSVIGIINTDDSYQEIYTDTGLNFSSNYPIRGVSRTIATGDTEIAWTDGVNGMRFLNITAELDGRGISDVSQVEYLTNALVPQISIPEVEVGGGLDAGAYRFAVRYKRVDGSYTPYTTVTEAVPIYADNSDFTVNDFDAVEGSAGGTATNKQILVNIQNIDGRYTNLEVVAVRRIAGVVDAVRFATLSIQTSCIESGDCLDTYEITIPFTGAETTTAITIEELTQDIPRYINAYTLAYHTDKRLYWGNLEREAPLDIQKYVNNFKIQWEVGSTRLDFITNSYKESTYVFSNKGFTPNEVYAYYFVPILNNGQLGEAYHIPGRVANDGDTDVLTDVDPTLYADDALVDGDIQRFHTRNTATRDGTNSYGDMGYWENLDEEYPNTACWTVYDNTNTQIDDLRCTPVRHHKFPSVRQLSEWGLDFLTLTTGPGGSTFGKILNIKLSNVWLPDEITEQIQGFHIFYAERNTNNATVLGTSMFTYAGAYNPDTTLVNTNTTNVHITFGADDKVLDPTRVRLHPFNLIENNVSITNFNYLRMEVQGYTGWEALGFFDSTDSYQQQKYKCNWLNQNWTTSVDTDEIRAIDEASYLGPNILIDSVETNISSEQCIRAKLEYTGTPTLNNDAANNLDANVYPALTMPTPTYSLFAGNIAQEEAAIEDWNSYGIDEQGLNIVGPVVYTYFTTLCQYIRNAYLDFTTQTLITGDAHYFDHCSTTVLDPTTSYSMFNGDTFLSTWGFKQQKDNNTVTAIDDKEPAEIEGQEGILKTLHVVPEYSGHNLFLRNEGDGDTEIQWPKRDGDTLTDEEFLENSIYTADNYYGYNDDYSWINDFGITSVNDSCSDTGEITDHPTRVIRSLEVDPTDNLTSWREYLSGDFYDNVQDKGPIYRIASYDDTLYIHHRNGLYRTRGVQAIKTDADSAYMGQGDIFQFAPKELVPASQGYAGIQSHYAGLVTKHGYVFVDQDGGRIFVVRSGIEEISSSGLNKHLYENLPEDEAQINPLLQQSVVVGYDIKYNRALFTKVGAFTMAYNFDLQAWEGTKSYVPSMYLSTQKQTLNIYEGGLYRHNVVGRRGRFYNDEAQVSYVDVVFNPSPTITKMFSVVKWITEVEDELGIGYYNETLDQIEIYTKYQYSGPIVLSQWQNVRNLNRTWHMNGLRDLKINSDALVLNPDTKELQLAVLDTAKTFDQTRRFIDKYVVVRFTINNTDANKKVCLLDVDIRAVQFNR